MSIPTQHPQQPGRQLRRPFQDRAFAGVAAGLGHRFNVSPAWFRVAFILLALAGGVGFLLYGIGWILIPDEGSNESIAEGWVDGFDASNSCWNDRAKRSYQRSPMRAASRTASPSPS